MNPRSLVVAVATASLLVVPSASAAPAPLEVEAFTIPLPGANTWFLIDRGGVVVDDGEAPITLRTEAIGRRGELRMQPSARPGLGDCWPTPPRLVSVACTPGLERPLHGATERWRNVGAALEQGFTIDASPPGEGPLVVVIAVGGAEVALVGAAVHLDTGAGLYTYSGLAAWDARGRMLPARLEVEEAQIHLVVDDAGATWPVTIDPVLATASRTLTQSSAADFGISVSLTGDVNSDGYRDLVVGARFGTDLYGEAFGYLGSANGIAAAYSRKWTGADYYGKLGEYVDNGGDINGDNRDDVLVSEFYSERILVYYGTANGFPASAGTNFTGAYGLGRDLAILGDLDNDGYDDVIVGAQEPDVEFFRGGASGLATTATFIRATTDAPSVAGAGRTNNDVYGDAIYGDAGANRAYIVRGASPFTGASITTLSYAGSVQLGFDVTGRGDVNGDGYDDVAVGDPAFNGNQGRVVVFYGASGGISSANAAALNSPTAVKTGFGYTVQMVGDINNDGYDDLAVADDYDHSDVHVFHGSSTGLVATPANKLTTGNANFGYSMSGGDANNDGFADLAIGTINGPVYIYHGCPDTDRDGYCTDLDCNDNAIAQNPLATESCNGIDDDCDGLTDDADTNVTGRTTWYRDADNDTYGSPSVTTAACVRPTGYVANNTDCNDAANAINRGATETCDAVDNDCDGLTDDADTNVSGRTTWYRDADNDTFGSPSVTTAACARPAGYVANNTDCNDAVNTVNVNATEACDGVDNDCDSLTDDADTNVSGRTTWYRDADNDTYGSPSVTTAACARPTGYVANNTDCNDAVNAINRGATETCDTIDNDCDSLTDDADTNVSGRTTWYRDADNDTYGSPSVTTAACARPAGYVANNTDCNDAANAINRGATETCDTIDNDCDSLTDDADTNVSGRTTWYRDADNDTYGSPTVTTATCVRPTGYVANNTDCNDGANSIYVGATETCDTIDNDCDSLTDDADTNVSGRTTWYRDADNDTYGSPSVTTAACVRPAGYVANNTDCNDAANSIYVGATETCDTIDNDCDSLTDDADTNVSGQTTWYRDADNDTFGDAATTTASCAQPTGYVANTTDCNDASNGIYPGATETCDTIDNDCDDLTDDADTNVSGQATWYADGDSDTFGDAAMTTASCVQPTGYVANDTDCNDAANSIYLGATETCDTIDNDCDSLTDDADTNVSGQATWYADADNDTFGDAATTMAACVAPTGYVADNTDCDDEEATASPTGDETCNGRDDDCDGLTDDADPDAAGETVTWYRDGDGDGHGDAAMTETACGAPVGYVASDDDCDDTSDGIHPGADELCNGDDDDCDGSADETWTDLGSRCDGGDEDVCLQGVVVCAADGLGTTCDESNPVEDPSCEPTTVVGKESSGCAGGGLSFGWAGALLLVALRRRHVRARA